MYLKWKTDLFIFVARKHDYDHYLCSLLVPRAARATVFTLRAFNVEVAQVQLSEVYVLL